MYNIAKSSQKVNRRLWLLLITASYLYLDGVSRGQQRR